MKSQLGSRAMLTSATTDEELSRCPNNGADREPDTFVKFVIGKEEKTVTVHREVACLVPVFMAAFGSEFIEGQTQMYCLDDVSDAVCDCRWSSCTPRT